MHARLIPLIMLAAGAPGAPAEGWKTESDNSVVEPMRRFVAPDETVAMADSAPAPFVFLTDCSMRMTIAGRPDLREGTTLPPMRAHVIPLVMQAAGVAALPGEAWKTEIENLLVQVVRRVLAPHERVSVADPAPALFVFLTEYPVRITAGAHHKGLRGRRGQYFWHAVGKIHLENPGEHYLDVARIAPKFRPDPAYQLPQANPPRVEFENEWIRMRHIGPPRPPAAVPARGSYSTPAPRP